MSRILIIPLLVVIHASAINGQDNDSLRAAFAKDNVTCPAMTCLFDDWVIADNSDDVIERARLLEAQQRFDFLMNWVLPSETHDSLRLTARFGTIEEDRTEAGYGSHLDSPAIDLIATAKELGRLPELRKQVSAFSSSSEIQQRTQLAMLAMLDMADGRFESALESMDQLFERHRIKAFRDLRNRWPETLVVATAIHHRQLHESLDAPLQQMLREQIRKATNHGPDPWDRLIFSLVGQLQFLRETGKSIAEFGGSPELLDWIPVSAMDAGTHGLGFPESHWEHQDTSVRVYSHHNNDFLYFRCPLSGNFEVECDATGFDFREAQLLMLGTWMGPAFSHDQYELGTVGQQFPNGTINPRLSEIGEWMRVHVTARDRELRFSLNGREIHRETLSEHFDPWLAIRVPFYTFGRVRNLQITGQPKVRDSVRLSEHSQLQGWTSYYGGAVGQPITSDWWHERDAEDNGIIVGQFQPWNSGTHKESLFRYQRPVVEDGTIEFDFFFEPGRTEVHPALGRNVLLINSEVVKIHEITDAHFDRLGADPLNATAVDHQPEMTKPQLVPGKWNQMHLQFSGESLKLSVNGKPVYRGKHPKSSDRTFGLFHYASDTEARVRNIIWRGDWSKSVPSLKDQELRDKTIDTLDAQLSGLKAEFHHDFVKDGLPLNLFQIQDQGADQYVEAKSDGLHVNAEMTGPGYRRVCITPLFVIHGDFDITADFEGLRFTSTEHCQLNAMLQIALTDDLISHHAPSINRIVDPGRYPRQVLEHQFFQLKPFHWDALDQRAEEVTSGVFRLARRGSKIHSFLACEGSSSFRLIRTDDTVSVPSRYDGARLITAMNSSVEGVSRVSVVWKKMDIRAEQLVGPAANSSP